MPAWSYVLSREPVGARFPRPHAPQTLLVCFLTRVALLVIRLRWRWAVTGALPEGGAVLVSAHTSYWDGVLASALDPRVHPVTGQDWRRPAVLGWYLRSYGVLWTDEEPIASAVAAASTGSVVWIAPTGWDKDGTGPLRRGAAEISRLAEVPVVALRLHGLHRRGLRPVLEVLLTEVIPPDSTLSVSQRNTVVRSALAAVGATGTTPSFGRPAQPAPPAAAGQDRPDG